MEMLSAAFRDDIHERLFYYVKQQDVECVRRMLTKSADPTKVVRAGRTAIGQATIIGAIDILRILLVSCEEENKSFASTAGQNMKSEMEVDLTPDGMEGMQWDEEIHETTSIMDDEWSNLFKYYANVIEQTRELLISTIKVRDPHCMDANHRAPIHYAAISGNLECLQLLLDYGAPVDSITDDNETPLHFAVTNRDILEVLLMRGANPNRKKLPSGDTPLHLAAMAGDTVAADMLLDAGADINSVTEEYGLTPLHTAIKCGQYELAHWLINKGARVNSQDGSGHTALFHAITYNEVELAHHLIERGARLLLSHYKIHYCVSENMLEMTKLLIVAGDNLNIRDLHGKTPLYLAIKFGYLEMVELLLKNGARLGMYNRGAQELHLALQKMDTAEEFQKMCRILTVKDINLNDVNCNGESLLMKAIMLEKPSFVEVLIREGISINMPSSGRCVDSRMLANLMTVRRSRNLRLLKYLVLAGLKLHHLENLRPAPWKNIHGDMEDWLGYRCTNPLSLKEICRIRVRDQLIRHGNNKKRYEDRRALHLLNLILRLDIPMELKKYLFDFDDVIMSCQRQD